MIMISFANDPSSETPNKQIGLWSVLMVNGYLLMVLCSCMYLTCSQVMFTVTINPEETELLFE